MEKLSPWQPPFPPLSGHRSPVSMKVSPFPPHPSIPGSASTAPGVLTVQGEGEAAMTQKQQGCCWHSCNRPPESPCHNGERQGIPTVQCAGISSTHSPLPHLAWQIHPLPPACVPTVSARWAGGARPTAGHLDRHSDPRAAGTGAEIKRRPLPLHVAVGALFPYEFHYCKLKLTAPIEYYQVLPEQPVVPFLALTTLSLMRQMHCRDFSPAQAASPPVSPSTPAANLMLPPAPAPSLPARGAGSSA